MKIRISGILLLASAAAFAQPVLRTTDPVVNGGSYANTIAPGSIFVVFGTNLAGDAVVQNAALPMKTSLGGVSIRFAPAGGGSATDALMVYTTRNQVAGLLPSSVAPGSYNVTLTYNGQTTAAAGKATVAANKYGIVTADGSGSGQAQAQNFRGADWDLNRFVKSTLGQFTTAPARPGQDMVLWGTGLGADTPSDLNGGTSGNQTAKLNVKVTVGSKQVTPVYAGRTQYLPGTDQINLTLPADVDTGCSVPLQVSVNGVLSNQATLAIVSGSQDACQHPFLSADALKRLTAGGWVTEGSFSLSKTTMSISAAGQTMDSSTEIAGGSFTKYGLGNLPMTGSSSPPIGTCTVVRTTVSPVDIPSTPAEIDLDAGDPVRLNGPNCSNVGLTRDAKTYAYSKMLAQTMNIPGLPAGTPGLPGGSPVLAAGTYTLTGPGGKDVGPFTASVAVPVPLVWTNKDSITTIDRGQSLPLTWTGGGANTLMITGMSSTQATGVATYDIGTFVCWADAAAGRFTVPASILSQLPASTSGRSGESNGTLMLTVSGPASGLFNAPLVAGGNVDWATFKFALIAMKTAGYK